MKTEKGNTHTQEDSHKNEGREGTGRGEKRDRERGLERGKP